MRRNQNGHQTRSSRRGAKRSKTQTTALKQPPPVARQKNRVTYVEDEERPYEPTEKILNIVRSITNRVTYVEEEERPYQPNVKVLNIARSVIGPHQQQANSNNVPAQTMALKQPPSESSSSYISKDSTNMNHRVVFVKEKKKIIYGRCWHCHGLGPVDCKCEDSDCEGTDATFLGLRDSDSEAEQRPEPPGQCQICDEYGPLYGFCESQRCEDTGAQYLPTHFYSYDSDF